jgi:hypothetical protein
MDSWNPDREVLRQHHKELLREAEERRLAGALRQSRRARSALRCLPMHRRQPGLLGALFLGGGMWGFRTDPADKEETHGWSG